MRRIAKQQAAVLLGLAVGILCGCGGEDDDQLAKSKPPKSSKPPAFDPIAPGADPPPPTAKKTPKPIPRPKPKKGKEEAFDPDEPMVPVEQEGAKIALEALGGDVRLGSRDRVVYADMKGTELDDKAAIHLAALVDLRTLNLSETLITDEGLKHLKGLTNLRSLFFYGCDITDKGLVHLSGLKRLEKLCLDETRVSDEGMILLEGLVELEMLHLHSRLPITDASVKYLVKFQNLKNLKIQGTKVTAKGLEELKRKLPDCRIQ